MLVFVTNISTSCENSRCCCNETPSTAGWNQDYFYKHFIQKLFSKKLCHAIYAFDTSHNPVRTAYACALTINVPVSHNIHLCEMHAYWQKKNQLCWFQYSVGKNIMISSCRWWHFLAATCAIAELILAMNLVASNQFLSLIHIVILANSYIPANSIKITPSEQYVNEGIYYFFTGQGERYG